MRTPMLLHGRLAPSRAASTLAQARSRQPRVLVVGAGPVGMALGFMLDKVYDIPTRIVERQATPTTHPQAHFLNTRTMEVLHATLPDFHGQLLQNAASSSQWRDYIYCTGIGRDREMARVDQFGPCIPRGSAAQDPLPSALAGLSPSQFLHFPQNRFESMLAEHLDVHDLLVERGVEFLELHQDDSASRPRVRLRHSATQQEEMASYDYVIGADGAHSLVRQLCGVDMVGALNLQSIVNVHFTSKELSRRAQENPAMLYFIFNENVIGILIAHDLTRGEWVFQIPFFPPQESIDLDFSEDQCKQIIRQLLAKSDGQKPSNDDEIDILSVGQWRMSARVAARYDALDHRVFLVGDAAHQFPPAGGLGMNTGIQDAHNLAWKLALAIQQEQDSNEDTTATGSPIETPTLLRSYERERQHIAKLNTHLSLRNVERTMKIPNALNVSHQNAKLLESIVNSPPVKFMPQPMQRAFLQNVMKMGKATLGLLDSPSSAIGAHLRSTVKRIVESRSSLGMLFYHFDIGFSYEAAVWAKRAKQLMQDQALDRSVLFRSDPKAQDDDVVFSPRFRVGERFPHFWCYKREHPGDHCVSTLDFNKHAMQRVRLEASGGKDSNVLFLLVMDQDEWERVSHSWSEPQRVSFTQQHVALVLLQNKDCAATGSSEKDLDLAADWCFACVETWAVDPASDSWRQAFSNSFSAALVRPDGHIGHLWEKSSSTASYVTADSLLLALQRSVQLS